MTETELWDWMFAGKYPDGYPDINHPEIQPIERRAFATLARDVKVEGKTWKAGSRVKVVMVSRMEDVGITDNLQANHGYSYRVNCLEGEYDVMGNGKQVIPMHPENLLLNIQPITEEK